MPRPPAMGRGKSTITKAKTQSISAASGDHPDPVQLLVRYVDRHIEDYSQNNDIVFSVEDRHLLQGILDRAEEAAHFPDDFLPAFAASLDKPGTCARLKETGIVLPILLRCQEHTSQKRCIYLLAKHAVDIPEDSKISGMDENAGYNLINLLLKIFTSSDSLSDLVGIYLLGSMADSGVNIKMLVNQPDPLLRHIGATILNGQDFIRAMLAGRLLNSILRHNIVHKDDLGIFWPEDQESCILESVPRPDLNSFEWNSAFQNFVHEHKRESPAQRIDVPFWFVRAVTSTPTAYTIRQRPTCLFIRNQTISLWAQSGKGQFEDLLDLPLSSIESVDIAHSHVDFALPENTLLDLTIELKSTDNENCCLNFVPTKLESIRITAQNTDEVTDIRDDLRRLLPKYKHKYAVCTTPIINSLHSPELDKQDESIEPGNVRRNAEALVLQKHSYGRSKKVVAETNLQQHNKAVDNPEARDTQQSSKRILSVPAPAQNSSSNGYVGDPLVRGTRAIPEPETRSIFKTPTAQSYGRSQRTIPKPALTSKPALKLKRPHETSWTIQKHSPPVRISTSKIDSERIEAVKPKLQSVRERVAKPLLTIPGKMPLEVEETQLSTVDHQSSPVQVAAKPTIKNVVKTKALPKVTKKTKATALNVHTKVQHPVRKSQRQAALGARKTLRESMDTDGYSFLNEGMGHGSKTTNTFVAQKMHDTISEHQDVTNIEDTVVCRSPDTVKKPLNLHIDHVIEEIVPDSYANDTQDIQANPRDIQSPVLNCAFPQDTSQLHLPLKKQKEGESAIAVGLMELLEPAILADRASAQTSEPKKSHEKSPSKAMHTPDPVNVMGSADEPISGNVEPDEASIQEHIQHGGSPISSGCHDDNKVMEQFLSNVTPVTYGPMKDISCQHSYIGASTALLTQLHAKEPLQEQSINTVREVASSSSFQHHRTFAQQVNNQQFLLPVIVDHSLDYIRQTHGETPTYEPMLTYIDHVRNNAAENNFASQRQQTFGAAQHEIDPVEKAQIGTSMNYVDAVILPGGSSPKSAVNSISHNIESPAQSQYFEEAMPSDEESEPGTSPPRFGSRHTRQQHDSITLQHAEQMNHLTEEGPAVHIQPLQADVPAALKASTLEVAKNVMEIRVVAAIEPITPRKRISIPNAHAPTLDISSRQSFSKLSASAHKSAAVERRVIPVTKLTRGLKQKVSGSYITKEGSPLATSMNPSSCGMNESSEAEILEISPPTSRALASRPNSHNMMRELTKPVDKAVKDDFVSIEPPLPKARRGPRAKTVEPARAQAHAARISERFTQGAHGSVVDENEEGDVEIDVHTLLQRRNTDSEEAIILRQFVSNGTQTSVQQPSATIDKHIKPTEVIDVALALPGTPLTRKSMSHGNIQSRPDSSCHQLFREIRYRPQREIKGDDIDLQTQKMMAGRQPEQAQLVHSFKKQPRDIRLHQSIRVPETLTSRVRFDAIDSGSGVKRLKIGAVSHVGDISMQAHEQHFPINSEDDKTLVNPLTTSTDGTVDESEASGTSPQSQGSITACDEDVPKVHETIEEAWERAIQPHHQGVRQSMTLMINDLIRVLLTKETAIRSVVEDYERGGTRLLKHIDHLQQKHNSSRGQTFDTHRIIAEDLCDRLCKKASLVIKNSTPAQYRKDDQQWGSRQENLLKLLQDQKFELRP